MRVEKIENLLIQALEGENADDLIKSLSDSEKDLFYQVLDDYRTSGDPKLIDELWKVDYVKRPPSIEEFIDSDYWLGQTMRPSEDNSGIFPVWRQCLLEDFDLDSRVHNLVVSGSLGIGKTWVSCGIFLYRVALATLLRNPQHFLGLSTGSSVVYAILSVSKSVVQETAFGDLQNFMAHSPYFLEECHFNPDKKHANFRIELIKNIMITAGSKGQHVIGRNTMGVALDEGNWRLEANPDMKAYKLYDEVRTRIKNRFQKTAGFLPAISILSSSARDESSFTEQIIADINKVNDPKTEKIYRFAVYHIKRHLLKLKKRWFKVAYGLKNVDPVILSGWYDEKGNRIEGEAFETPPSGMKIELVPEDYYDAFLRNIKTALQSVCGISTGGSHLLFSSLMDVQKCVDLAEEEGVEDPARCEFIPLSDEDDKNLWDYLEHSRFLTMRAGQIVPKRHSDAKRYAHVDLATQSVAGLAICHPVATQRVDGLVKNGIVYSEYRQVVEYDMILSIVSGRTRPISLEKIQRLFFWLRQECGFHFGKITADSYQSEQTLQMMAARGFDTAVLSLDRKKTPYYAFRTGFEELRIRPYNSRMLLHELERLVDLPDKIDHPPESAGGSKDIADACAGAYYNCVSSEEALNSPTGTEPALNRDALMDSGLSHDEPVMTIPVAPAGLPNSIFIA